MTLVSYGKFIDTALIGSILVQGEKNADIVIFEISRYYDGYDISDLVFIISGINSESELAEQVLPKEILSDKIILEWRVGAEFTVRSGLLELEVRGVSPSEAESDEDIVIKFSMPPVNVRKSEYSDLPAPDVIENAIDRIHIAEDNINNIYNSICETVVKVPYIENGMWFVYDVSEEKYINTGVSAGENSRIVSADIAENSEIHVSVENNTEYRYLNGNVSRIDISAGDSFSDENFISSVVFRCSDNISVNIGFDFTYIYDIPPFRSEKIYCLIFFNDGFGIKCLWYEV
jgi:hypothetical protein